MRVYQWVKNLLLFLPVALAHRLTDLHALSMCLLGFISFSFMASSVYILNDILDIEHDRTHPRKRHRPLAAGHMTMRTAWILLVTLFSVSTYISIVHLPIQFGMWLALYVVVTSAYSFALKRMVLIDVIVLAGLYSLRMAAGGALASVVVSTWLLGFSLFLFMSLAFLKRYTELKDTIDQEGCVVSGRGYHTGDAEFILVAGSSLGLVSVLVFTLYVTGPQVQALYTHPYLMWLIAPCIVYWISHLWLVAHRGGMHDDPIVFAARDPISWAICATVTLIAVMATF